MVHALLVAWLSFLAWPGMAAITLDASITCNSSDRIGGTIGQCRNESRVSNPLAKPVAVLQTQVSFCMAAFAATIGPADWPLPSWTYTLADEKRFDQKNIQDFQLEN